MRVSCNSCKHFVICDLAGVRAGWRLVDFGSIGANLCRGSKDAERNKFAKNTSLLASARREWHVTRPVSRERGRKTVLVPSQGRR